MDRPAVEVSREPGCACCLVIVSGCILAPAGFLVGWLVGHSWHMARLFALIVPSVLGVTVWLMVRQMGPHGFRIGPEGIVVHHHGREDEQYAWAEVLEIQPPQLQPWPLRIVLRSGQTVEFRLLGLSDQAREAAHTFAMAADPNPERILRYYRAFRYTRDFVPPPVDHKITALHAALEQLYGHALLNTGPEQDKVLQTMIPLPNKNGPAPGSFSENFADPEVVAYWTAPCALYFASAGPLVTLDKEENCPPERLSEVLKLVCECGFDFVPSASCHQSLPDGDADEPWTWFDVFFGYD